MYQVNVFILVYLLLQAQGLDQLSLNNYTTILETDDIIKDTISKLFEELQFKNAKQKYEQALLVHNFFSTVSLKDHNTLNVIFKISRTDRSDNNTDHYMTLLNEILNENLNDTEADGQESIFQYIDEFLNNLNVFKEKSIDEGYDKLDIKEEIIHILKSDNPLQFNALLQNGTKVENSIDDNEYVSDNEFWAPGHESRRIYKGNIAKIKYFPFMASIHFFKSFQCAGSIIKSDLILTAASCLQLAWNNRFFRENPAFLSVNVGSNFFRGGGEEISVLEVYFHPGYDPKNLRNNIACLRLSRHLKFRRKKRKVKKIDIDRSKNALSSTTDGITIVGWGAKGSDNLLHNPWTNQLSFSVLDVYDLEECQAIYSRQYVTRTNFCAGFILKGGGACNHDVGGPGVVNGILAGIISFGSPVCGAPDAPTVFTKVGFYAHWIEEIMNQDVPTSYKRTTLKYIQPPPTPPPEHLKPTTFHIEPLPNRKPPANIDTVDISEDDNLFKDFLKTMFDSKELNDYKELLLNDDPGLKTRDEHKEEIEIDSILSEKPKNINRQPERIKIEVHKKLKPEKVQKPATIGGFRTVMDIFNYETEEKGFTIQQNKQPKYTHGIGEENEESVEQNIEKLLKTIDLTDTKEQASKETNRKSGEMLRKDVTRLNEYFEPIAKKTTKKLKIKNKIRDEIVNLLYLTDNERDNISFIDIENDLDDFDDDLSVGLPIDAEGFRDLTFRNNMTDVNSDSVLNFMSQNELYDLLSKAIDAIDEVEHYKGDT